MTTVEPVTGPRLRVAAVGLEPALQTRLRRLMEDRANVELLRALGEIEVGGPGIALTVVVLGPEFADQARLEEALRLVHTQPSLSAVLVAEELTTSLLQRAMRAGVSDVVTFDSDPSDLEAAIERAAEQVAARLLAVPPPRPADDGLHGRVITVFSPKGGSGKSVVACNLAVLLAERSDQPVALVDADLQFGDVAVMLKLAPHHTIVDAVSAMHRLDASLMRSLLSTGPNGVLVLPAPREPAFGDQVTPADMHTILELLRSFCSHVVVDTPTQFSDVALHLIEESDDLVLVAGMDVPSIKNMKIGLQTLKLLGTPQSKLRLVLNRANAKVGLDVSEVEKTLHLRAEALLPSDIIVPQSVNKGIPAVLASPRSGFARTMTAFSEVLTPALDKSRRR
ncbi:MAG TPA: P-loop NTPase [Acidimicrobiales bacterium]|nr:P-loop NTPase [Acidimicrobiales bacterium]